MRERQSVPNRWVTSSLKPQTKTHKSLRRSRRRISRVSKVVAKDRYVGFSPNTMMKWVVHTYRRVHRRIRSDSRRAPSGTNIYFGHVRRGLASAWGRISVNKSSSPSTRTHANTIGDELTRSKPELLWRCASANTRF